MNDEIRDISSGPRIAKQFVTSSNGNFCIFWVTKYVLLSLRAMGLKFALYYRL